MHIHLGVSLGEGHYARIFLQDLMTPIEVQGIRGRTRHAVHCCSSYTSGRVRASLLLPDHLLHGHTGMEDGDKGLAVRESVDEVQTT